MGSAVLGCGFGWPGSRPLDLALFDAGSARACVTQPCECPVAGVAILPDNFHAGAFRLVDADMLRLDGIASIPRFAPAAVLRAASSEMKRMPSWLIPILLHPSRGLRSPPLRCVKYPSPCRTMLMAPQTITVATQGRAAFHSYLVGEGMRHSKRKQQVIPSLELLPSRRAQFSDRIIVGGGKKQQQQNRGERSGIVCETEHVVPQRNKVRPSIFW